MKACRDWFSRCFLACSLLGACTLAVNAQSGVLGGRRLSPEQQLVLQLDSHFVMPQHSMHPVALFSLPMTAGIWIVRNEDRHFQRQMAAPAHGHKLWYDLPLAALPLAANYGLKAAGVPSRHDWKRMLVSQATGGAVAFAACNMLKNWVSTPRPDASSHHSFPSGHTALAFASAAMLEEEYGHLSPWVSLGGYACATGTAFLRIHHNRHWLSDVVEGFAIGTAATRMGYIVGDWLFGNRGILLEDVPFRLPNAEERLSRVGFGGGAMLMPGHYSLGQGRQLSFKTGYAASAEGTWFLSRHCGWGGTLGLSTFFPKIDGQAQNFSLQLLDMQTGPRLSYPLGRRWRMEGNAQAGIHWLVRGRHHLQQEGVGLHYLYSGSMGMALECRTQRHMTTRLHADYGLLWRHSTQTFLQLGIQTAYCF